MPLKLSLKPGEKFVINGAVVVNGDRRASLILQNQASILRERDILREQDVDTPVRRIYFPIMMMYLDSEQPERYYDEFALRMSEFMNVISRPDLMAVCVTVSREVMSGQYYKALMTCRKLLAYEEERLAHVPEGLPESTTDHRKSA